MPHPARQRQRRDDGVGRRIPDGAVHG
jgi:hypothetical protein